MESWTNQTKLFSLNDYVLKVHNKEEANLFKKLVTQINDNSGASHPGDYLPILKVFGHSYQKKVKALGEAMDTFLQRLLDDCRRDGESNTMLSHLLSLQHEQPKYYSDVIIKGLMLVSTLYNLSLFTFYICKNMYR